MFGTKKRQLLILHQQEHLLFQVTRLATAMEAICNDLNIEVPNELIDVKISEELEQQDIEMAETLFQEKSPKANGVNVNGHRPLKSDVVPATIIGEIRECYERVKEKPGMKTDSIDIDPDYQEKYIRSFAKATELLRHIYTHETGRRYHRNVRALGLESAVNRIRNTPVARTYAVSHASTSGYSSILNARAFTGRSQGGQVQRVFNVQTLDNYIHVFEDFIQDHLVTRCVKEDQGDA